MTSSSGHQLGDYRILEPIGAGGMGEVYVAENVHSQKRCALKVLPRALAGDPNFVHRFFDEARVMSDLRHAHIVQVHHTGRHEGVYFLVMDYVTGPDGRPESLHDRLKDERHAPSGRLPEADVRRWAIQVAEALAYAHERGVVHRDLKPANILLDKNGNAVLTDFGLAKVIGSEFILSKIHETMRSLGTIPTLRAGAGAANTLDVTAPGSPVDIHQSSGASSLLGTYDYMAPEQRGEYAAEVGARTDIYALGVVLYRLLTGRRPFGLADPPSTVISQLDTHWDVILARCANDDPAGRYASAHELLVALKGLHAGGGRSATRRIARVVFRVLLLAGWGICVAQFYHTQLGDRSRTQLEGRVMELEALLSSALSEARVADDTATAARVRAEEAERERDTARFQQVDAEREREVAEARANQTDERAARTDRERGQAVTEAAEAKQARDHAVRTAQEAARAREEAMHAARDAEKVRDEAQARAQEAETGRREAIARAEQAELRIREYEQARRALEELARNRRGIVTIANDTPVEISYRMRWQRYDGTWSAWDVTRITVNQLYWHSCLAAAGCEIEFDYTATDAVTYDAKQYWLEFVTLPASIEPGPLLGKRFKFVYDSNKRHIDLVRD